MEKNCKSHSCDDPEHEHQLPELKDMKKNLEKQLQKCGDAQMYGDKPEVSKALRASTVSSLGREARFAVRAASVGTRDIRHLGEATPTVAHVEPIQVASESVISYESCKGCGIIHKSMQACPRCTQADNMTEAADWRMR